jgi:hypothetical protein
MPDILALAALIAFFSIAVLFVRACERIIGPNLEAEIITAEADAGRSDPGQVAA